MTLSAPSLLSFLAFCFLTVQAIVLDLNDPQSIRDAAATAAYWMQDLYNGNTSEGVLGKFPFPPYYWWESGAAWGAMVNYWHFTGDASYVNVTFDALMSQLGPNYDYVVPAEVFNEGNDDQAFWAFAGMDAAEFGFPAPTPPAPSWLQTVVNAWNLFAQRWAHDSATCGGGLKWQFYPDNAGYYYKNSISNGGFFQLSARLARYTGNDTYLEWAERIWNWTSQAGLIDEAYNVFDGADEKINCAELDHHQWTYNVAVFLYGSAVLQNHTNASSTWVERTSGLLNAALVFSSPFENATDILFEAQCEHDYSCNIDQLSMKAYLARWLARTSQMAPNTAGRIGALLKASALGAASSCTGGPYGNTCGVRWYINGFDNHTGLGQQLSATEIFYSLLVNETSPPGYDAGLEPSNISTSSPAPSTVSTVSNVSSSPVTSSVSNVSTSSPVTSSVSNVSTSSPVTSSASNVSISTSQWPSNPEPTLEVWQGAAPSTAHLNGVDEWADMAYPDSWPGHRRRWGICRTTATAAVLLLLTVAILVLLIMKEEAPAAAEAAPPQPSLHHDAPPEEWYYNYTAVGGYFLQDDPETDAASFDFKEHNFGLIDQAYESDGSISAVSAASLTGWQRFAHHLVWLNEGPSAPRKTTSYRLLFLGRHGQGYHNVGEAYYGTEHWDCYWSLQDGNGTVTWADARLTDLGIAQARDAHAFWLRQITEQQMTTPASFYVSPLDRAIHTADLAFRGLPLAPWGGRAQQHQDGPVPYRPLVKELLREGNGLHTTVISFTAHSGTIAAILEVVAHRKFPLQTGGVIPVLVRVDRVSGKRPAVAVDPWEPKPDCAGQDIHHRTRDIGFDEFMRLPESTNHV
ncbi:hypothetical protein DV735_g323, partial [Chaetothyriales sp. CBS 134920]